MVNSLTFYKDRDGGLRTKHSHRKIVDELREFLVSEEILDQGEDGSFSIAWAHYTPDEYIEAVREVMGEIDLDPATCHIAQKRVQAVKYYTSKENGLAHDWHGRVLLCPPYAQPILSQFVDKLKEQYDARNFSECITLTHTSSTWEDWFHKLLAMADAICFVRGFIDWVPSWRGYEEKLAAAGFDVDNLQPYSEHGSCLFYIGPNKVRFKEVFNRFGEVI